MVTTSQDEVAVQAEEYVPQPRASELYVDRLRYQKGNGFRAKISKQWYLFRRGVTLPIDGPFKSKAQATTAKSAIRKGENMTEKKTTGETGGKSSKAPGLEGKTREYTRTNPETGATETGTFPRADHHATKAAGWTAVEKEDGDDAEAEGTK